MFTLGAGIVIGIAGHWFFTRFKEPLQSWRKRKEAEIEKTLKGD
jgi:hypothetical protein